MGYRYVYRIDRSHVYIVCNIGPYGLQRCHLANFNEIEISNFGSWLTSALLHFGASPKTPSAPTRKVGLRVFLGLAPLPKCTQDNAKCLCLIWCWSDKNCTSAWSTCRSQRLMCSLILRGVLVGHSLCGQAKWQRMGSIHHTCELMFM